VVKVLLPASGPGPGGEGCPLAGDAKGGNTAGGHSTSLQAILQYLPYEESFYILNVLFKRDAGKFICATLWQNQINKMDLSLASGKFCILTTVCWCNNDPFGMQIIHTKNL
jgi:hypothetical protein